MSLACLASSRAAPTLAAANNASLAFRDQETR
jgi:hypothetical protein